MTTSAQIIKAGNIAFGTSGARGLVVDFTPEICAAFTLAFLSSNQSYKKIAIAIDNRPSSPDIASYCIAAAQSVGVEVDYYGVIPTPALAYTAMEQGIASIMVTGSHIPFDRNGLKFYRPDGEISKSDEQAILSAEVEVPALQIQALPCVLSAAADNYIKRYKDLFSDKLLAGKKIGIYEHSSAGRDLYAKLFKQLGAEVVALGRSDEFIPIDTEAVAQEDIKQAQAWVEEYGLDAVYSTDGDGDRPLLSDETGNYLRGDILCLLAAKYLQIDSLAVPVSCNSAIEESHYFKKVVRTKIGSPYVIEAFLGLAETSQRIAGFEANGGFLLASDIKLNHSELKALPTRDALLPALAVLAMSHSGKVSSLLSELPAYYTASDRIQNIAREKSLAIIEQAESDCASFLDKVGLSDYALVSIDKTDGLRLTLTKKLIVHLRPSGNAPELRCYVESDNEQQAQLLVAQILNKLSA